MAKIDEEILDNEYSITPYTIKYDSKTKRFFGSFTPTVGGGVLASAAIFTLLVTATVLTGGVAGVTVGAVAGVSAGLGTLWQAVNVGYVYRRNSAKRRFKSLGIGGKEDSVGTIGIIENCEQKAHKYTQLLEQNPELKKFVLEDGATYTRKQIQKRIKENETIAYRGLKYILKQGTEISKKIDTMRKKTNPTEYERSVLEKYWDTMDRIGACVKNVASKRLNFNPYKGIIIDSMQKGCLLGNYEQNNQIRAVASINNREETTQLYFKMYEEALLKAHAGTKPTIPPVDRKEHEAVVARNAELTEENVELKTELESSQKEAEKAKKGYARMTGMAKKRNAEAKSLRKTNATVTDENKGLKKAVAKLTKRNQALTQQNDDLIEEVTIAENETVKYARRYEGAVRRGVSVRTKNKKLKNDLTQTNELVDELEAEIESLEGEISKQQFENSRLQVDAQTAKKQAEQSKKQADKHAKRYEGAVKRAVEQRAQKRAAINRAEDAENTVDALYHNQTKLEQQKRILQRQVTAIGNAVNSYAKQNVELRTESRQNAELAEELGRDLRKTQREIAKVLDENDFYKAEIEDLKDNVDAQQGVIDEHAEEIVQKQTASETQQFNFKHGQMWAILENLVDRVEAHVEYTKENQESYDKNIVKGLERIIDKFRVTEQGQLSISEVVKFTERLRGKYDECKVFLAPISDKKLREYDDKIHNNKGKSK